MDEVAKLRAELAKAQEDCDALRTNLARIVYGQEWTAGFRAGLEAQSMGTKHTDSCLLKAADDEPIFVLRAQDALAPATVRHWCARAEQAGTCPPDKLREAYELAAKMEAYQSEHGSKNPD